MTTSMAHGDGWLRQHADSWVDAGLVSADQADAIRRYEASKEAAVRVPVVTEVAVYLGSVIALMAGAFVVGRRWDDLTVVGRGGLGLVIAVIGLAGGAWLMRLGEAGSSRLGGFLWALAAGGVGMTAAVFADEAGLEARSGDGSLLLAVGIPVLVTGLALWRNLDRPLQLLTAAVGAGLVVGGIGQFLELTSTQGAVVVWVLGVAFGVVALVGNVVPRTFALVIGSFVAWMGSMMLMEWNERWAPAFAAATAAVTVIVGSRERLVPVLAVGVLTFLFAVQMALQTTFSGAGSSMIVAVIGLAIVVIALVRTRRADA